MNDRNKSLKKQYFYPANNQPAAWKYGIYLCHFSGFLFGNCDHILADPVQIPVAAAVVSSLIFYAWAIPAYSLVIVFSVLLNYYAGRWIEKAERPGGRRRLLTLGIILNLLFLASFRYFNTISQAISGSPFISIPVPLGISFFTFSNISYLVEIKRGTISAEKHIGYFAVFVTFFPKVFMGPIERPAHFLPQVKMPSDFDYSRAISGMRLMLWGFFKKLVIADQLGLFIDPVYNDPGNASGSVLLVATVLYAFQIYMDFSGYIDIARGAGSMLGFDLLPNFNRPYLSKSVREFWTRWHITLSTWLRDYLFLPLAYYISGKLKRERYFGVKAESWVYAVAITVTFLVCGIWHGAGWTYFTWGALFAVYLVTGFFTKGIKRRFYKSIGLLNTRWSGYFQVIVTFSLVWFTWIFFRSESMNEALVVIKGIFTGTHSIFHPELVPVYNQVISAFRPAEFMLVLALIPITGLFEKYFSGEPLPVSFGRMSLPVRWSIYYVMVLLIFYFGKFDANTFIYFQF